MFSRELERIGHFNNNISKLTETLLRDLTDKKFWTEPASATGVHHPKTSNGFGGNVTHTKQAFWIANTIIDTLGYNNVINSCILSATLLHDIDKFNESIGDHGITASNQILAYDKYCESYDHILYMIAMGVRFHMGKWGNETLENTPMPQEIIQIARVVHLADYLSSRPFLEFNEKEIK